MSPPREAPAPKERVLVSLHRRSKAALTARRSMDTKLAPSPKVNAEPNTPYVAPTCERPARAAFSGLLPESPLHERTPVGPTGGERPQANASRAAGATSAALVKSGVNARRKNKRIGALLLAEIT
jgi:hypothetical protein